MVAILFSLAQMQSVHPVRCPREMEREGNASSTSTRLLSSGVPFTLSGNTTASIFISREIEISSAFCLPPPSCDQISNLLSRLFFGSKIEFKKN